MLSGEPVGDVDRAREAEVGRVEDLVAVGVEVDRFGVHSGLVVERVFARDELVVRDVDLHERGDELVELAELWQVVLLADRGWVVCIHPRHEAAERRNPVAFADPEHARVDVRGAAFEDRMAVRDRAACVVVPVELDVAGNVMPQLDRERVALSRRRDPDGVRDPDPVHAHLVNGGVDLE